MPKSSRSSNEVLWPLKGSRNTSRRSSKQGSAARRSSAPPSTRAKRKTGRNSGRPSGAKSRNRRDELLRRLKVDAKELEAQPQIAPLLKQCGILPARVIEVLRADQDEASRAVVKLWDELTPANRNILGLEALAMATGITPRRLWEVYSGANMMQSREVVGNMILDSLPSIIAVTIKEARKAKGTFSREHILKAARVLPTPKGSVINIGTPRQDELPDGDGDDGPGGMLEGADDFLMRASRAMGAKALPAPAQPEILAPEDDEEE